MARYLNLCSLNFHKVHDGNSELLHNETVAKNEDKYYIGYVFSDRPVLIYERVHVKFLDIDFDPELYIGFTMRDPQAMNPSNFPNKNCEFVKSFTGNWAAKVKDLPKGCSTCSFYVDNDGNVSYTAEHEERGILFGGVNTSGKLWAVLGIRRLTVALEVSGPDQKTVKRGKARSLPLKNEASPQQTDVVTELIEDYKSLWNSGKGSDVTLKVGDQQFNLHRAIITARSPVFSAMFQNEMQENVSGVVCINEGDANIFELFFSFLYFGNTEGISDANVTEIHKIADKYDVSSLVSYCISYMMNNISVSTFCDFFSVAITYDESEMLEKFEEFFANNIKDIISSSKWQIFIYNYPEAGEKHYKKALEMQGLLWPL